MQGLGSHFCAETEGNLKGSFAQLKHFFISAFSGSAHIYDKFLANILFNMIKFIFFKTGCHVFSSFIVVHICLK